MRIWRIATASTIGIDMACEFNHQCRGLLTEGVRVNDMWKIASSDFSVEKCWLLRLLLSECGKAMGRVQRSLELLRGSRCFWRSRQPGSTSTKGTRCEINKIGAMLGLQGKVTEAGLTESGVSDQPHC